MKSTVRTLCLLALGALVSISACKKGKDSETAAEVEPSRPPTPSGTMGLQGLYTQVGAYGSFQDCTTGEQWPVAHEGDNRALEAAYLASGVQPRPLVVTIEGGIDYRPRSDGQGKDMVLIVARFVQVGPAETCQRRAAP